MTGRRRKSVKSEAKRMEEETNRIIRKYLRARIFPMASEGPPDTEDPAATMIWVCADFEERYDRRFSSITEELRKSGQSRSLSEVRQFFLSVARELFPDCVKWGRIVALFSFAGCLCNVMCKDERLGIKRTMVKSVQTWLSRFMKQRINPWVMASGGWDVFVNYFKRTHPRRRSALPNIPWFSLTGIAVGLYTIGKLYLSQEMP